MPKIKYHDIQYQATNLMPRLYVAGYFHKWRHFPAFAPFVYMQMEISPLKMILYKNARVEILFLVVIREKHIHQ